MTTEREHLRLYFDTCAMHNFALTQPWNEGWSPKVDRLSRALREDMEALYDMFRVFQTTPQELVFSDVLEDEMLDLAQRHEEADSLDYFYQLVGWVRETFGAEQVSWCGRQGDLERLFDVNGLRGFPDSRDRMHLALAIDAGCDYFITVDYRTIISGREHLRATPMRIMRPIEYCTGCEEKTPPVRKRRPRRRSRRPDA